MKQNQTEQKKRRTKSARAKRYVLQASVQIFGHFAILLLFFETKENTAMSVMHCRFGVAHEMATQSTTVAIVNTLERSETAKHHQRPPQIYSFFNLRAPAESSVACDFFFFRREWTICFRSCFAKRKHLIMNAFLTTQTEEIKENILFLGEMWKKCDGLSPQSK